jgi:hypothetical protein
MIDASASAQGWTNHENIARTGLTALRPLPPASVEQRIQRVLERIGVDTLATFARKGWSYCKWLLCSTVASHASAFTRRNDFTAEPANTIQLSKNLNNCTID